MRPIPAGLRGEMERDYFYQKCAVTQKPRTLVKVEWHHNLIYAGRQVNEKFCILPLSEEIHDRARDSKVKEFLNWIMTCRATREELEQYGLTRMAETLQKKYGQYDPTKRYKI
jgi:hypothetical protein